MRKYNEWIKIRNKVMREWRNANRNDQFLDGEDIDERIADWWLIRLEKLYKNG